MSVCRSSGRFLLALALALAPTQFFPAVAQGRAPIRLIPVEPPAAKSEMTAPPPGASGQAAPAAESGSLQSEPGAVEVGQLRAYDPSSVGLLYDGQGGFPTTLWQGTPRATVEHLLPRLPASKSATLQALSRQLLLTAADVPQGQANGPGLLALRVDRLLALGDNRHAADLAKLASPQLTDSDLNRAAVDAFWYAGDDQAACARVPQALRNDRDPIWLEANAYCRVVKGDQEAAAISAGLLREQKLQDPAFFALLAALTGDPGSKLASLPDPTPLQLAMLRAAKLPVPGDVVRDGKPAVVTAVAGLAMAAPELRLDAAARAEAYGDLPAAELAKLYAAVSFPANDLANAPTAAREKGGPLGQALLYQAVLAQQLPLAQAEALKLAFAQAMETGGSLAAAARLYAPQLTQLPPSDAVAWFSPTAARALLSLGRLDAARAWIDLARTQAVPDRPETGRPAARLAVLLQLADPQATTPLPADSLKAWWDAAGEGVTPEQRASRATFLYTLLDSLGQPVPNELWQPLIGQAGISAVAMPEPALRQGLVGAAEAGRLGETVLLALLNLGTGGPAAADPSTLANVIRALRKVGLGAAAGNLAVEAALAHDL